MEVLNGTIVRIKTQERYWVCIHHTRCDMDERPRHNKHNKNHTGFYLFSGLWYDGDVLTDKPYGKCLERLERGMFPEIEIMGHISTDYEIFREYIS